MTIPSIIKNSIPKEIPAPPSPEFLNDIAQYRAHLIDQGLPVIYSVHHLGLISKFNINNMIHLCNMPRDGFYKRFKMKKKKGGYRVIQTPSSELKYLQRWILKNILENRPSHECCKGFDLKASIKNNAESHLNKEAILKIDFLRFFDSINEKQIYRIFKGMGYHGNVAFALAKICSVVPDKMFFKSFKKNEKHLKKVVLEHDGGILPQGAPTSPKLSNLFCLSLDHRLTLLASKNNLSYTRYADDLTFSGDYETLISVKKTIYKIIKDEKLFVNMGKTKILKRGSLFFVTGLSVNNKKVTIPRKKKKDIEHHLHHCIKNGVENHMQKSNITNRNFKDWLFGNIAFVYSVEKELGAEYFKIFGSIQWPI
ncbi:reverse transcriptase family protein [Flavobacterium fluviale]|uniref:RNA-directed DNA polymerase n=1 Tax=Flavobacterium fluviale TaxID=2249356 RepID=A0A344LUT8_9FLAO|nr:reverse transcriptase family protein [Flavobacterium fluviale]AXB57680.1 hypothetical protein HYN86_14175 [Flavobacterium fluviale]